MPRMKAVEHYRRYAIRFPSGRFAIGSIAACPAMFFRVASANAFNRELKSHGVKGGRRVRVNVTIEEEVGRERSDEG